MCYSPVFQNLGFALLIVTYETFSIEYFAHRLEPQIHQFVTVGALAKAAVVLG